MPPHPDKVRPVMPPHWHNTFFKQIHGEYKQDVDEAATTACVANRNTRAKKHRGNPRAQPFGAPKPLEEPADISDTGLYAALLDGYERVVNESVALAAQNSSLSSQLREQKAMYLELLLHYKKKYTDIQARMARLKHEEMDLAIRSALLHSKEEHTEIQARMARLKSEKRDLAIRSALLQ